MVELTVLVDEGLCVEESVHVIVLELGAWVAEELCGEVWLLEIVVTVLELRTWLTDELVDGLWLFEVALWVLEVCAWLTDEVWDGFWLFEVAERVLVEAVLEVDGTLDLDESKELAETLELDGIVLENVCPDDDKERPGELVGADDVAERVLELKDPPVAMVELGGAVLELDSTVREEDGTVPVEAADEDLSG